MQGDLRPKRPKIDESNNCSNYFQIVSNGIYNQYFLLEPEEEEWNHEN